jgi:hypothetical protein
LKRRFPGYRLFAFLLLRKQPKRAVNAQEIH